MEEAEADRWRICQEQSLQTVSDQMDIHCPLSPSLSPSFSLHAITPVPCYRRAATLQAKRCWRDSLLPTENLLHRKQRRESGRAAWFTIFFYVQPWASRWGCRAPLAIESSTPFSGQAGFFLSWLSFIGLNKKLKHDPGAFYPYYWCLNLHWTMNLNFHTRENNIFFETEGAFLILDTQTLSQWLSCRDFDCIDTVDSKLTKDYLVSSSHFACLQWVRSCASK